MSALWMPMINTADIVADRYGISREKQDEYSLQSQQRTAAAQTEGKFNDEIIPVSTKMDVINKETKEVSVQDVTVDKDECNRPQTTLKSCILCQLWGLINILLQEMQVNFLTVHLLVYSWTLKRLKKRILNLWEF